MTTRKRFARRALGALLAVATAPAGPGPGAIHAQDVRDLLLRNGMAADALAAARAGRVLHGPTRR